jgi:hypothetical protein
VNSGRIESGVNSFKPATGLLVETRLPSNPKDANRSYSLKPGFKLQPSRRRLQSKTEAMRQTLRPTGIAIKEQRSPWLGGGKKWCVIGNLRLRKMIAKELALRYT